MKYDAIIVITPNDYKRVRSNFERLISLMPAEKLIFVGSKEVGEMVSKETFFERTSFINENDILPFEFVHSIMKKKLNRDDLPRGITGWYYQQFLKMRYAFISENEYYLSWDGDTIPTKHFEMFKEGTDVPYFDMKYECHEEYFNTLERLLGFGKVIRKSFISEHMLFNCKIRKEMISQIEANDSLQGESFYERILNVISPENLLSNSFSEFETYGNFVAMNYPTAYRMKDWHSIRYGSIYFKADQLTEDDFEWLGKDFDAITFEKNQEYNPDIAQLFLNPMYRIQLTARQFIEAIQDASTEGMREEWEDSEKEKSVPERAVVDEIPDTSIGDEYLLFNYLGDNLAKTNINQAFLCYENAEFLCPQEEIKTVLRQKKDALRETGNVTVKKTAIVIVSYNASYLMLNCLASIRKYCAPSAYNIIVVDNASTDGVTEWLKEQGDINLLLSDENLGFPKGCNVGISYADRDDDILLLNNDTRMTHNALFWLRMGLYEDDHVGATGSIANYCGIDQLEEVSFGLPDDYVQYGAKINVLMKQPYEEKNKLGGFSMLMKRVAFDKIGKLEEAFSPGYFEDDDISTGIHVLGYRLLVCHNSFIYHAGSQSFIKRNDLKEIFERNHHMMIEKWKYDTLTYSVVTKEEADVTKEFVHNKEDYFRVLEVGAGSGNMLSRLHYLYPLATIYGIEANETVVRNGIETVPLLCLDWRKDKLPFTDKFFDYIIYNDRTQECPSEEELKRQLIPYLKDCGKIISVFKK